MASTERKQNIGCDENILYPVDYTASKHKSTYNFDTSLALTTPFSGEHGLDELSEQTSEIFYGENTERSSNQCWVASVYLQSVRIRKPKHPHSKSRRSISFGRSISSLQPV